jgi:Icc-related predicted phosphoesterase
MIIDCIGCLHGERPKLKGGDLLIVTGDLTARDTDEELDEFDNWLDAQEYKKKIFIAGNHDNVLLDEKPRKRYARFSGIKRERYEYLCDSGTEYEGLSIWGSPWTASFPGINPKCKAFTIPFGPDTEDHLMNYWELIPKKVDILITHSPPYGILDGIPQEDGSVFHVGSKSLHAWIKYVERPRLHVFSHIHEAYGREEHFPTYNDEMMISVNCSIMNEKYKPVNKPIRIIL